MSYDIDKNYLLEKAYDLLTTDSPSGFTEKAMKKLEAWVTELGYNVSYISKGGMVITLEGEQMEKTIGLSAHVDTLGAMVRSISPRGTLRFTLVGSPIPATLDSEYCRIYTRAGSVYTGTVLSNAPASHVYDNANTLNRIPENMEIRIDSLVKSKKDVEDLGICNGDFICFDPKTVIKDDFIKSRFIDDKGSVVCLLTTLKFLSDNHIKPRFKTKVLISNYEEVGHGASFIPSDIDELLAVDMGCIGDDLSCTEYDVSICAKDSSGPYDYNMVSNLINFAKKHSLSHAVDIYPYYGSDVSSALRGGNNIKGALIGPGVHASHGMERTHFSALENTVKLILAYLIEEVTN